MRIVHPEHRSEWRQAMALLVDRSGMSPCQLDYQIDLLMRHAESHGLELHHCLLGYEGDRVAAACLVIDQPGRTSSLFLPLYHHSPSEIDGAVRLVRRAREEARHRGVQLMQALVEPNAGMVAQVFRSAGFERLTRLDYLERDVARPWLRHAPHPTLSWVTYSQDRHEEFARVIQATYEGSLDCVSLNTRRAIDDVITSHRATGQFDPRHWFLAMHPQGHTVGVLLLAFIPERWACEVVYLGLIPPWRKQGFGARMICKTLGIAREMAANVVSLTVDAGNHPARRLYDAAGFRQTASRDAWVCFL